jgi:hypothetical protein
MKRMVVSLLATVTFAIIGTGAAFANDSEKEAKKNTERNKNYPVTVGKVTLPASKMPVRETVHEASPVTRASTAGRFTRQGKAVRWTTGDAEERPVEQAPARATESKGYFVQQGKAIIWVEN